MTHAVLHPLAGDLLQTSLARSLSLAPYHQGINILTPHNGLCPSTPLIAVLTFPPLAISHLTAFTLLFSLLEDPASNHHHRAFKTLSQTTQSGHPLVIPETLLKFISQWLTAVITRRSSMWVGSPPPVTTVTPRESEHGCKESRQRGGREPRPSSSPFFGMSLYSVPILLSIRK